jgi:hypothetical protein
MDNAKKLLLQIITHHRQNPLDFILEKDSATWNELVNIWTLILKETAKLDLCTRTSIHITSPPLSYRTTEQLPFGIRNDLVFYLLYAFNHRKKWIYQHTNCCEVRDSVQQR